MSEEDDRRRSGSFGARVVDVGPIVRLRRCRGLVSTELFTMALLELRSAMVCCSWTPYGWSRPRPSGVGPLSDPMSVVCHSVRNCLVGGGDRFKIR